MLIPCPIQEHTRRSPNTLAITTPQRQYSYVELDRAIHAAMEKFLSLGFHEGNRVGMLMEEGPAYPILLMACFRLGLIACPCNPRFPEPYLRSILRKIRCTKAILSNNTSYASLAEELRTFNPVLFLENTASQEARAASIPIERPATIVLSSGSSGTPKAVLLSVGNHYHNALRSNQNLPVEPGDSWLMSLPFYHVAGLGAMFRCLLGGARMAFPSPAATLTESLREHKITHISMVATQLHRALHDKESVQRLASLKAILLGGGPLPDALVKQALEAGLPLYTTYGLTEMASQVTTTRPNDGPEKLLTSGPPLHGDSIELDKDGEICVRGKTLFLGYVDGENLQRPLDEEGRFHTGDLACWDAEGYLSVLGRRDNMFIAGGENIHPEEIEARIQALPGIEAAVVVPVSHREFGATPVAFVKPAADTAELQAALRRDLPKYKIPRHIFPWPNALAYGLESKIVRHEFIQHAQELVAALEKEKG